MKIDKGEGKEKAAAKQQKKNQLTDTKPLINHSSKTSLSQIIMTAHYRKI